MASAPLPSLWGIDIPRRLFVKFFRIWVYFLRYNLSLPSSRDDACYSLGSHSSRLSSSSYKTCLARTRIDLSVSLRPAPNVLLLMDIASFSSSYGCRLAFLGYSACCLNLISFIILALALLYWNINCTLTCSVLWHKARLFFYLAVILVTLPV